MLAHSSAGRTCLEDQEIAADLHAEKLELHLLRRVSAKNRTFDRVSFRYTIFDNCYLRNCRFTDCDFTGTQFIGTNLRGSTFDGSRFDYCRFTATLVPHDILERHMPGYENVALELARSLKTNYGQIGDAVGVNLAVAAELKATKTHLRKAAWSAESYYRKKYRGMTRLQAIGRNIIFEMLDWVWGNGESVSKLLRTILILNFAVAAVLIASGEKFIASLALATKLFLGVGTASVGRETLAIVAAAARFVLLGLFISVLVKRLGRR